MTNNYSRKSFKMIKLLLLPLIIASIPSGLVLARFAYKRLNLLLEEKRLELDTKRDEYTNRLLKG